MKTKTQKQIHWKKKKTLEKARRIRSESRATEIALQRNELDSKERMVSEGGIE
jgi:hypothetical protein